MKKDIAVEEGNEALRLMKKMPSASHEERMRLLQRVGYHHEEMKKHVMDEALDAINSGEITIDKFKDMQDPIDPMDID